MTIRLAFFLLAFSLVAAAAPLAVVCSLERPVIGPRQTVTANVYVDSPDSSSLRYAWKATGGKFDQPDKAAVEWDPSGAAAGSYDLSVTVTGAGDAVGNCILAIIVGSEQRSGPQPAAGFSRETRAAMLFQGKKEQENCGLYSYMLLGAKPNSSNKERFRKFLETFLGSVLVYDSLNRYYKPPQLNIAYLPIESDLPPHYDVDWVLDNYDYERARSLLGSIPGTHGDGPFIVSADRPLQGPGQAPARYLFEDLTTAPPSIVEFWVKQFRAQTAQEHWDSATLSSVALRLRTAIEVAAIGFPMVRNAVSSLVVTSEKK